MNTLTARALKQKLFDAYGGFANKRIKNIDKGNLFIIDDHRPSDLDARGKLLSWFCPIWVEVLNADSVKVTLRRNVPQGRLVARWIAERGLEHSDLGLEFVVSRGNEKCLAELADDFRDIVREGPRYRVPSYKYVCPRTANSLDRFRGVLREAWKGA